MTQIISTIQSKGGASKSTLLQIIGASMAQDGAKVLVIDTDPQASCVQWASEQDIPNLDVLPHLDEDKLLDIIDKVRGSYDAILIDTAGFDSRMAGYVVQYSDLILIPSGGSKFSVKGCAKAYMHADVSTRNLKNPPVIRAVIWNVNKRTEVYKHAKETITEAGIPTLSYHVGHLVGFEAMSWNGGLPTGVAGMARREFMASLQLEGLIEFYNKQQGAADGKAA